MVTGLFSLAFVHYIRSTNKILAWVRLVPISLALVCLLHCLILRILNLYLHDTDGILLENIGFTFEKRTLLFFFFDGAEPSEAPPSDMSTWGRW